MKRIPQKIITIIVLAVIISTLSYNHFDIPDTCTSGSVLSECFNPKNTVSYSDAILSLDNIFDKPHDNSQPNNKAITVKQFLQLLSQYSNCIVKTKDGFAYITGDSKLMSQDQFETLCQNKNRKLSRDTFDNIINNLRTYRADMADYETLKNQDAYAQLIHDYFREFAGLYNLEPKRARYWLDSILSGRSDMSRLSNILHEIAHEESAKSSGAYLNKAIDNNIWRVIWHENIEKFRPYNPSTGEFVEIQVNPLPTTREVLNYDDITGYVT